MQEKYNPLDFSNIKNLALEKYKIFVQFQSNLPMGVKPLPQIPLAVEYNGSKFLVTITKTEVNGELIVTDIISAN